MTLLAATPSPLWYLTRGSGVVTLILLTASVCLGILTSVRWRADRLPRFVVAGLHRNVTMLAVAFLVVHVMTTVADGYTPIGLEDAVVPFVSSYRPIWLGLGTLACDLLIAVVLTSVFRARIGYRTWRATHWLAYGSWPLALVHSLGTGSDARFGWMAAVAVGCMGAVAVSVLLRLGQASGGMGLRAVAGTAAIVIPLAVFAWYRSGPAKHGWAARAGTPAAITLAHRSPIRLAAAKVRPAAASLPGSFDGNLTGRLTQVGPDESGLVTVRIDTTVHGRVRGTLRLALQGVPAEQGGVNMTASGVAFAATGSPVFEGSIVELHGNRVSAQVSASNAGTFELVVQLRLNQATGTVTGVLRGVRA